MRVAAEAFRHKSKTKLDALMPLFDAPKPRDEGKLF
jgi:hypothetical protein